MKLETAETQSSSSDGLIVFPNGLPGFAGARRFRLYKEADQPTLFWMQSEDDPGLQFSVTDPALLKVQYEIVLSDEECALLQLEKPEDITILVLLYSEQGEDDMPPGDNIHANFLGPLVINTHARIGIQKVLTQIEDFVTIRAG